ncbi:hypothetical protein Taro_001313 [Colocasia esculenta]|uniref:Uncharacterized protein n=1 Tax=Colocasia esculenta TaxID=4460 RepID=A0A843TEB0_COLES|nr:hypothetical protein [Colocasia esculenta]
MAWPSPVGRRGPIARRHGVSRAASRIRVWYQRDPVTVSGHRPACSDKGPSFRAGSARFAP